MTGLFMNPIHQQSADAFAGMLSRHEKMGDVAVGLYVRIADCHIVDGDHEWTQADMSESSGAQAATCSSV